ncbi:MAG TPA: acylphosphatase [Candidatus Angelobacter sp.]|nr:acylphosphatase [Candidatus Angelobacter sp.]
MPSSNPDEKALKVAVNATFAPIPLLLATHRHKKHCAAPLDLASSGAYLTGQMGGFSFCHDWICMVDWREPEMKRSRMHIFYSGTVQGVGFRYTVKTVAAGFEVVGTVRNLTDGRVELVGEGARQELEAFQKAIRDEGLEHFIKKEDVSWSEATNEFRGFDIVR